MLLCLCGRRVVLETLGLPWDLLRHRRRDRPSTNGARSLLPFNIHYTWSMIISIVFALQLIFTFIIYTTSINQINIDKTNINNNFTTTTPINIAKPSTQPTSTNLLLIILSIPSIITPIIIKSVGVPLDVHWLLIDLRVDSIPKRYSHIYFNEHHIYYDIPPHSPQHFFNYLTNDFHLYDIIIQFKNDTNYKFIQFMNNLIIFKDSGSLNQPLQPPLHRLFKLLLVFYSYNCRFILLIPPGSLVCRPLQLFNDRFSVHCDEQSMSLIYAYLCRYIFLCQSPLLCISARHAYGPLSAFFSNILKTKSTIFSWMEGMRYSVIADHITHFLESLKNINIYIHGSKYIPGSLFVFT